MVFFLVIFLKKTLSSFFLLLSGFITTSSDVNPAVGCVCCTRTLQLPLGTQSSSKRLNQDHKNSTTTSPKRQSPPRSAAAVSEEINLSDCCFSKPRSASRRRHVGASPPLSGNYRIISSVEQMSEDPCDVNSVCKQSWTHRCLTTEEETASAASLSFL